MKITQLNEKLENLQYEIDESKQVFLLLKNY